MTRDYIIRMARECGVDTEADTLTCYGGFVEVFEQFAALVAAAAQAEEREACAKVCETLMGPTATDFYGKPYAAAIRARGQA